MAINFDFNDFGDLRNDRLQHYQNKRKELLQFITEKAEPALVKEIPGIKRNNLVELSVDALQKDRFTLVLIGAFQSGKSTLFNYLCDGRELSPVGPGNGGVRTSGCQTSAHPLPEGEEEYALLKWRSAEDLLASLGDILVHYYPDKDIRFLTPEHINLYNPAECKTLGDNAFKELEQCTDENKLELLRFALIVARFFEHFSPSLSQDSTRLDISKAVDFIAYPQDWRKRWREIIKSGDKELKSFKPEEVNFAFCGGVEFYLNSPVLRSLDCSIIDCPGLFISKWDTEIAKRCIRSANAILYMFKGDKEMSAEDVKALKTCVDLGGSSKIIFGANLHKSRRDWKRVLEDAVEPGLAENGFDHPRVNNFHSGLALRSKELFLAEIDALSPMSVEALNIELQRDEKEPPYDDSMRQKIIRKKLKQYIETLTDYDEEDDDSDGKTLKSFKDKDGSYRFAEIEALSGVPAFMQAATDHVLNNRYKSMLIDNGTAKVLYALRASLGQLEEISTLLNSNRDEAQKQLEYERKTLKDFNRKRELAHRAVKDSMDKAKMQITKNINIWIEKWWRDREKKLATKITKAIAGLFAGVKIITENGRAELAQRYVDVLKNQMEEFSRAFRMEMKSLCHPQSFVEARDTFEGQRTCLLKDVAQLKGVPSPAEIVPVFPDNFDEILMDICLEYKDLFRQAVWPGDGGWGDAIKNFCDYLITWQENYAQKITHNFLKLAIPVICDAAEDAMNSTNPEGMFTAMNKLSEQFEKAFELPAEQLKKNIAVAQELLKEMNEKATILPGIDEQKTNLQNLIKEAEDLDTSIREQL